MRLVLIDHYDSFTFNVIDWLESSLEGMTIERLPYYNIYKLRDLTERNTDPLVLPPGPNAPHDCPATMQLLKASLGKVPILGICLGHQMLGVVAGGRIVQATTPFHGSTRQILPTSTPGKGLLAGIAAPFSAATYNSLAVTFDTPHEHNEYWQLDAYCSYGDVQAMSFAHPIAPAFGVQFHPESFLSTEENKTLLANWLAAIKHFKAQQ